MGDEETIGDVGGYPFAIIESIKIESPDSASQKNPFKTINCYSLLEQIGGGGMGRTYRAINPAGEEVCLKEFRFGLRSDEEDAFKLEELFQREANVLKQLNHQGIPEFKEYFTAEENGEVRQYIAMEYVSGQNLQQMVEKGYRFSEKEAAEIAEQVLGQLEYLHSFAVPIVHRDVKPSNLIKKENGCYALVDFGSVHDKVAKSLGGSTVIGTYGYAPMEMFYGKPCPKTDVYSLAATMVYLLSGKDPADFMNSEHRLDLEKLNITPDFRKLLYGMTELNLEKRLSVAEVKKRLGEISGLEGAVEKALVTFSKEDEINGMTELNLEKRLSVAEVKKRLGEISGLEGTVEKALVTFSEENEKNEIMITNYGLMGFGFGFGIGGVMNLFCDFAGYNFNNEGLKIVLCLVTVFTFSFFGRAVSRNLAKRKIRKEKERQALEAKLEEKVIDVEFKEMERKPIPENYRIEEQEPEVISEPEINSYSFEGGRTRS